MCSGVQYGGCEGVMSLIAVVIMWGAHTSRNSGANRVIMSIRSGYF